MALPCTALLAGIGLIGALGGCADGGSITDQPSVVSIAVSPDSVRLRGMGDTVRLRADGTDADGNVVTGLDCSWTSENPSVATVTTAGLVTATGFGSTTVTAVVQSVSGTSSVAVGGVTLDELTAEWESTGFLRVHAVASAPAEESILLWVSVPVWVVTCFDHMEYRVNIGRQGLGVVSLDTTVAQYSAHRAVILASATTEGAYVERSLSIDVPGRPPPPVTVSAYLERKNDPYRRLNPDSLVVGDTIAIRIFWTGNPGAASVDWDDGATDSRSVSCLDDHARMLHAYTAPGARTIVYGAGGVSDTIRATVR